MAASFKRKTNRERKTISLARLMELLHYDPATGVFTRLGASRPQSHKYVGQVAGYIKPGPRSSGGGYRIISVDGRTYRAHHLATFYMTGEWPEGDIDHEDTDRDNNAWSNLRPATRIQNLQNASIRSDNTSGLKGVSWDASRRLWVAQICVNGKRQNLGRHHTKEQAHAAYCAAAERHFGEFARTA